MEDTPRDGRGHPQLMVLIKKLTEYEKHMDTYTATEERYRRYGFCQDAIFKALRVRDLQ
jgi:hypothetical protein